MPSINRTILQVFHWYTPNDGTLWKELSNQAESLVKVGFTAVWLPPASKGCVGPYDVGYTSYDLFDLGEFDQRQTIRTKYGTKDEYANAVKVAKHVGLHIYADVVFGNKSGGDDEEEFEAIPLNRNDFSCAEGDDRRIKSRTKFDFHGRGNNYSSMKWHWWHFNLTYFDSYKSWVEQAYLVAEKHLDYFVDPRRASNYDYAHMMDCHLDFESEEVCNELMHWGCWFLNTVEVDGFRFNAAEQVSTQFLQTWIEHVSQYANRFLFGVSDYWSNEIDLLLCYISETNKLVSLFDVPLHYKFHYASRSGNNYDMRHILDGTLMQQCSTHAVTFVENHDSQPLRELESSVEPWFKPLAYALILLRAEGYPCVFYADYYGAEYEDRYQIFLPSHRWLIDKFLHARQNFAYGPQYDYFDHWNVIGWTRLGDTEHPQAIAVIMSNGAEGSKWMEVGKPNTKFIDLVEHIKEPVYTNEAGWGEFYCKGSSVSVWIEH